MWSLWMPLLAALIYIWVVKVMIVLDAAYSDAELWTVLVLHVGVILFDKLYKLFIGLNVFCGLCCVRYFVSWCDALCSLLYYELFICHGLLGLFVYAVDLVRCTRVIFNDDVKTCRFIHCVFSAVLIVCFLSYGMLPVFDV
eukprot:gene3451-2402_t